MDGKSFKYVLEPGTLIDRYGSPFGSFVSPEGTPFRARALKPGTDAKPFNQYEVTVPIETDFGRVQSWFGFEGKGWQADLPTSVDQLLRKGHLRKK